MPSGICDSHIHLIGDVDRYPVMPSAFYLSQRATLSDYEQSADPRIERVVIVQPSCYGFDNSCLLDGLIVLGDRGRGVAGVGPSTDAGELRRLTRAGVKGARFNALVAGAPGLADLTAVMPFLTELELHAEILVNLDQLNRSAAMLVQSGITIVIAHFGPIDPDLDLDQPAVRLLDDLLSTGRLWLKLSAPYRLSRAAKYGDLGRFARHFVEHRPDRILWGSDWPYLQHEELRSHDYDPCAALLDWIEDPKQQERILNTNPAVLYGFAR